MKSISWKVKLNIKTKNTKTVKALKLELVPVQKYDAAMQL